MGALRREVLVSHEQKINGVEDRVSRSGALALIDGRTLSRECFIRAIEISRHELKVFGFTSVADWKDSAEQGPFEAVFYNIGSADPSNRMVGAELRELVKQAALVPVIVIAESENLSVMIQAIECGARGCIPASVGIDIFCQATILTACGGIFLPTEAVLSLRNLVNSKPYSDRDHNVEPVFTSRQALVAEALRQGKANKIIAYELNMCESTVKVHVRNILRKLNATNRTEAAFRLSSMAHAGHSAEPDGTLA